jgi:cytosine/adenosine deaminase-related metal-dependent hydrolase
VVEDEEAILRDTRRVIEQYHDAAPLAMTRVVVAPCSPFTVTPDLMRESAKLARSYGVHLHTHLAETLDEERYCVSRFRRRPAEYAEHLDWTGADVWHAHCVHLSDDECARLGSSRTGAAHCPSSNMRLASGVAPLRAMLSGGMRVGLGVDGSSSNDSGHLLGEARQAMLLQRVARMDPGALTAREALRLATRGGAEVLGRDDVGQLAPGMAADVVGFRLDTLPYAGAAVHDALASLVFCQPQTVDFSIIAGQLRVEDGHLLPLELPLLVERQNSLARQLVRGEP